MHQTSAWFYSVNPLACRIMEVSPWVWGGKFIFCFCRSGNFPHEANRAAAVDQLKTTLGKGRAKRLGRKTQVIINSIA